MLKIVFVIFLLVLSIVIIPPALAQEFKNPSFSENLVVAYNHQLRMGDGTGSIMMVKTSGDVEVSVGLQSSSNNEFKFSNSIIETLRQEPILNSIVFTNKEEIDHKGNLIGCVPGVKSGNQCILINLDFQEIKKFITDEDKKESDGNVKRVQLETKKIGESLINDINQAFNSDAKFHSVYIQPGKDNVDDERVIEGTVSAVYIMPKQSSTELFKKISQSFISNKISGAGGFYDIAKELASDSTYDIPIYEGQIAGPSVTKSTVAMTIFLDDDKERYMLNVSTKYINSINSIGNIWPLDTLSIKELNRSDYFDNEFTPLNSILDVLVFTDEEEPMKITSANSYVIKKISSIEDITKKGWFFEKSHGNFVAGKFLFGDSKSVSSNELKFSISPWDETSPVTIQSSVLEKSDEPYKQDKVTEEEIVQDKADEQSQYAILAVIIVVAVAAAIYYMKGYKSKH